MDEKIARAVEVTRGRRIIKARHPAGQIEISNDSGQSFVKVFSIARTYGSFEDGQLR